MHGFSGFLCFYKFSSMLHHLSSKSFNEALNSSGNLSSFIIFVSHINGLWSLYSIEKQDFVHDCIPAFLVSRLTVSMYLCQQIKYRRRSSLINQKYCRLIVSNQLLIK